MKLFAGKIEIMSPLGQGPETVKPWALCPINNFLNCSSLPPTQCFIRLRAFQYFFQKQTQICRAYLLDSWTLILQCNKITNNTARKLATVSNCSQFAKNAVCSIHASFFLLDSNCPQIQIFFLFSSNRPSSIFADYV